MSQSDNIFTKKFSGSEADKLKCLNSAAGTIVENKDFDYFYLIDFGLSYVSQVIEDKAVDLYVLKRAIISANPRSEEIVKCIIKFSLIK